jgi:hypothetical protein
LTSLIQVIVFSAATEITGKGISCQQTHWNLEDIQKHRLIPLTD